MSLIEPGTPLPPAHPSEETLDLLAKRRSVTAQLLGEPGPSPERLNVLLEIAARVPDHRKIEPFRYVVFEGKARTAFGEVLRESAKRNAPDAAPKKLDAEASLFERAPVVVAVVSSVDREHKTPEWEQVLTAGAVCQNLLIAASAAGFAGQWLTGWPAYDEHVLREMGLGPNERIAGFIYLGTAQEDPKERPRPALADILIRWEG